MKKIGYTFLLLFLVGIICFFGALLWWRSSISAVNPSDTSKQRFVIPKGKGASEIGYMLEKEGLIKSPLAFKIYVQLYGKQESINAGEFSLSPSMSIEEIAEALGKGPLELWVTIPEGLRREEVVERLIDSLEMDKSEAAAFRSQFLSLTSEHEGYLFPDTYLFPRDVSAQVVVNTMLNNFEKRFPESKNENFNDGLTLDEVVTLASIIEKETKTDEERPIVAGIYFNRMEIGQALQADATVQYPLGTRRCSGKVECDWWVPPTKADYEFDSPYNTYSQNGLPPSPIANPGISSLNAVVKSQITGYYYYIHDKDGVIHYAKTLEEHNANIAKYLR